MRIVIDTRLIQEDPAHAGDFTRRLLEQICAAGPEHRFLLLLGKKRAAFLEAPHVESLPAGPTGSQLFRSRLWMHVQLPALIKKWKGDLLLTVNGPYSASVSKPQALLFTHFPAIEPERFKKYVGKAAALLSFSDKAFENAGILPVPVHRFLAAAGPPFSMADYAGRQATKEKYTGGKEYFLYTGSLHQQASLILLLKAFSIFKKRQQSGMRLVLPGALDQNNRKLLSGIQRYKYRDELQLTGALTGADRAKLTAAAYAVIGPVEDDLLGVSGLEAAISGAPLIAAERHPLLDPDDYLRVDMQDPVDLARGMMQLYKDESLRNNLVSRAGTAATHYTFEKTAAAILAHLQIR